MTAYQIFSDLIDALVIGDERRAWIQLGNLRVATDNCQKTFRTELLVDLIEGQAMRLPDHDGRVQHGAERITRIAHEHGREIYNLFADGQPISVEYAEEMVRCAIEEAIGESRQRPKEGFDQTSDVFPYL